MEDLPMVAALSPGEAGLQLERQISSFFIVDGLLTASCEAWDKDCKTDAVALYLDGEPLHCPFDIQLTRVSDDLLKMEGFVEKHTNGDGAIALYVQIGKHASPKSVSFAVRSEIELLDGLNISPGKKYLIVVEGQYAWKRMSLDEHIETLRAGAEKSQILAKRQTGIVTSFFRDGVLMAAPGENQYFAALKAITDTALRERLNWYRMSKRDPFGLWVSFVPNDYGEPYRSARFVEGTEHTKNLRRNRYHRKG